MNDLKKPYEISLWGEEFVYIIKDSDGNYKESLDKPQDGEEVVNHYIKEKCLAVIGANTLNTPIRAFKPKFVQQVNGTKTLTFQIFSKYYDEDEEEFKLNPFINLLVNERKVKLKYDGKWYDFIIKDCQENSETKVFSYTCKDLHINELSKSGYDLTFDVELENNHGTIIELADVILEESEWEVDKENSEIIQQKEKENLYTCQLINDIEATCMADFSYGKIEYKTGDKISIPAGEVIYVFYSSFIQKESPLQFLYYDSSSLADTYITSDEGVILNSPNWQVEVPGSFFEQNLRITTEYFGEKLVAKHLSRYVSEIDKYCNIYTDGYDEYYGYSETEYASVTAVQNLLINSNNFLTEDGWVGVNGSAATVISASIGDRVYKALSIDFGTSGEIINNGLYDNRKITQGFTKGEKYIFAIQCHNSSVSGADIRGAHQDSTNSETSLFTFTSFTGAKPSTLDGYQVFEGTCTTSISLQDLLLYNINFYVKGSNAATILDAKLFKKVIGDNGNIIVPDLEETMNSIIRTKYYIFRRDLIDGVSPRNIFSTEDLTFSHICYADELEKSEYTPVKSKNYEKIRSITASKSNRFNLIQDLCESFECWADFSIGHDERGRIKYNYELIDKQEETYTEGRVYYKKIDGTDNDSLDINFRIIDESEISQYNLIDKETSYVVPTLTYYTLKDGNYEELLFNEGNFDNENAGTLLKPKWVFKKDKDYYLREDFYNGEYYRKVFDKKITFKKYIGQDNPVGFRYGINLKSIQRTINSDQITTKMIVEPNVNEFAKNGSCTIQTSILNPTGENVLYNFEYYIRHNLLARDALYDDLYGTNKGLGLYIKMREWNNEITAPIEELASISNTLNVLTSRRLTYNTIIAESDALYQDAVREIMAAQNISDFNAAADFSNTEVDNYTKKWMVMRDEAKSSRLRYEAILNNTVNLIADYNNRHALITHRLNQIARKKAALNTEFYRKYSRFLQEGSWTSPDYIDPEDYYLDSQMVLFTSAFPKITYNINVVEISQIEGFAPYTFKIGDKTYMEDTEFFGWRKDGRPYQEEIVVSEVSYSLDEPAENTIKVQNFKTQFEDLFQRVVATSQALQYHEGEYKRAANAINPDGSINSSLLQTSLENNSLILKNAKDQSVTWDETGITISNFVNPNEVVRLVSGGIVLTADGGRTWTTGITGKGINAEVITTGRLDTEQIRIFNSIHQTFEWNSDGISAFATGADGKPNYSQYVRYNQYGLYGYMGNADDIENLSDVLDKAYFSLTWKGLKINLQNGSRKDNVISVTSQDNAFIVHGDGSVSLKINKGEDGEGIEAINVNDAFIVYTDGSIKATKGEFSGKLSSGILIESPTIKTGNITGGEINIGLQSDGSYAFSVNSSGQLTAKSGTFSGALNGGSININDKFIVTSSGNMTAYDGTFYGSLSGATGTFSGNLSGNKIYIGTQHYVTEMKDYLGDGTLYAGKNNTGDIAFEIKGYDGIRLSTHSGNVFLKANGNKPASMSVLGNTGNISFSGGIQYNRQIWGFMSERPALDTLTSATDYGRIFFVVSDK